MSTVSNISITNPGFESFSCSTQEVQRRIQLIDCSVYDKTRNYLDGAVTWLSPFLTHGITNTREVGQQVLRNRKPSDCYCLLFEFGWPEYFHRFWQEQGEDIFENMRNPQKGAQYTKLPSAVVSANTGIDSVDQPLRTLYSDGVMHNHARMWTAAISCKDFGCIHYLTNPSTVFHSTSSSQSRAWA